MNALAKSEKQIDPLHGIMLKCSAFVIPVRFSSNTIQGEKVI